MRRVFRDRWGHSRIPSFFSRTTDPKKVVKADWYEDDDEEDDESPYYYTTIYGDTHEVQPDKSIKA